MRRQVQAAAALAPRITAFLVAAALLGLVAVPARTAQAQQACVTVTTAFPIVFPTLMSVGDGVQVFVNASNATRTFPGMVFVPGQIGGDVCQMDNTCQISGKACTVDADCTIQLRVRLACRTSACAVPLPGTLVYVDPGGNGCLSSAPGVVSCAPESSDPNNPLFNNVMITLAGGAANAIPIGANDEAELARIQTIANSAVKTNTAGNFVTRVDTTSDFFFTDDAACVEPVTGGGGDSASALFPPVCEVEIDKQISCDGGTTFVDQSLVEMNEDGTFDCTAWNAFDGVPAEQVIFRYQARNTGNVNLFLCSTDDSNPNLPAPLLPDEIAGLQLACAPNGLAMDCTLADIGNTVPGVTTDFATFETVCSEDLVAGANEPNLASIACLCEGAELTFPNGTTAEDEANLICLTPALEVSKVCQDLDQDMVDETVEITVSNASLPDDMGNNTKFLNCQVTDTIYRDDLSCPPVGAGEDVPVPGIAELAGLTQTMVSGTIPPPPLGATSVCNLASVTCEIEDPDNPGVALAGKSVTATDEAICSGLCAVEFDKKVSGNGVDFVDGKATGWGAYDSTGDGAQDMPAEPVALQFTITNTGSVDLGCTLVDEVNGNEMDVVIPNGGVIPAGSPPVVVQVDDTCRAEIAGVDMATLSCECLDGTQQTRMLTDSAELECLTPDLFVIKACLDDDGNGADETVDITVSNPGTADLENCTVTDTLDLNESLPDICPGDGSPTQNVPVTPPAFNLAAGGNAQSVGGTFAGLVLPACNEAVVTCDITGTQKQITRSAQDACEVDVCEVTIDKKVSGDGGATFLDNGAVGWNGYDSTGDGVIDMPAEAVAFQFTAANTGLVPVTCTLVDQHTGETIPVPLPNGGVIQPGETLAPIVVNDVCRAELVGIDTARLSCECGGGLGPREVTDTSDLDCRTPDLAIAKVCLDQGGNAAPDAVEVTVTNLGNADLENCQVSDTLDLGESPPDVCPGDGVGTQGIPLIPASFPLDSGAGPQVVTGDLGGDLQGSACNTASVTCDIVGTDKSITRSVDEACVVDQCNVEIDKKVSGDGGATFLDTGAIGWGAYDSTGDGVLDAPAEAVAFRFVASNTGLVPVTCTLVDEHTGQTLPVPLPNGGVIQPGETLAPIVVDDVCRPELAGVDTARLSCECGGGLGPREVTDDSDLDCRTPDLTVAKVCRDDDGNGADETVDITVTNLGSADLANCQVSDALDLNESLPNICPGDGGPTQAVPVAPTPFDLAVGAPTQPVTGTFPEPSLPSCNTTSVTCDIVGTQKQITRSAQDSCEVDVCEVTIDKKVSGDGGATFLDTGAIGWNAYDSTGDGVADMPAEAVAFQFVAANTGLVPVTCTLVDEHTGQTLPVPLPNGGVIQPGETLAPIVLNDVCRAELVGVDTARLSCECGGGLGPREVTDASDLDCRTPDLTVAKVCRDDDGNGADETVDITVTNLGSADLANCQVTDALDLNESLPSICPGDGSPTQAVTVMPASFDLDAQAPPQMVTGSFPEQSLPSCNTTSVTCDIVGTQKQITRSAQDSCEVDVCEVTIDKKVSGDGGATFLDTGAIGWNAYDSTGDGVADMPAEAVAFQFVAANTGLVPVTCTLVDEHTGQTLPVPLPNGGVIQPGETLAPIVLDDVCRAELVGVDTARLSCECGGGLGPREVTDDSDLDCRTPDLTIVKQCLDEDQSGSDDAFSITVGNPGTADLESCQVVDTLDRNESSPDTCPGDGVDTQGIPVLPASFGLAAGAPDQQVTGDFGGDLAAPACNTAMVTCTITGTEKTISRTVDEDCFGGICAVEIDKKVSGDGGATFLDNGAVGWNGYDSTGDGVSDMEPEAVAFQFTASNTGTVPVTCTLVDQHTGEQIQVPLPNGGVIQPGTTLDPIVVNDVCRAELVGVDTATLSCVCGNNLGDAEAMDSSDLDCRTPDLAVAKVCLDADQSGSDDSFEITVTNLGSAALESCSVVDTIDLEESTPGTCPGDGVNTGVVPVAPMSFGLAGTGSVQSVTGSLGGDLAAPACNTAMVTCTISGTQKTISREVEAECFGGVCDVAIDKKVSGDGGRTFLDTGAVGWNGYDSNGDGVADMPAEPVAFRFTASNLGTVPVTCTLVDEHTGETLPVPLPNGGVIPPDTTLAPIVVDDICRAELVGVDTARLVCECGSGFGERQASDTSDLTCRTPGLKILKWCLDDDGNGADEKADITITNLGNADLVNCQVTDTLDLNESLPNICPGDGGPTLPVTVMPEMFDLGASDPPQSVMGLFPEQSLPSCNTATVTCDIAGTQKQIARTGQDSCEVDVCEVTIDKKVSGDGGVTFLDSGAVGWNGYDSTGDGVADMPAEPVAFQFTAANTGLVPVTCTLVDEHTGQTLPVPLPNGGVIQPGQTLDPIVVDDVCRPELVGTDTARLVCECGGGLGNREVMDQSNLECRTPDLKIAKMCMDNDGSGADDAFQITVTNLGNADLANCQVVDTVDLGESLPDACANPDGVDTQVLPVVPASFALGSAAPPQLVTGGFGGDLGSPACNTAVVTCEVVGTQKTISRQVNEDCFGGVCAIEIDKKVSGDGGATFLDSGATGWNGYDSTGDGVADMPAEPVAFQFTPSNTGTVPVTCTLVDEHTGETLPVPLPNGGVIQPGETLAPIVVDDVCRPELEGTDTAVLSCVCGSNLGDREVMDQSNLSCRTPDLAVAKMCLDGDRNGSDDSFSITVTNLGNANLLNCQVVDTLDRNESLPSACANPDGIDTQVLPVVPASFPLASGTPPQAVTGDLGGDLGAPACNTAVVTCDIAGTQKTISRSVAEDCFGGVCEVEIDKKVSGDGGATFLDTGAIGWNAYDSTGDGVADMPAEPVAFQFVASNTGTVPVTCTLVDQHTGAQIPVPLPNGGVIQPGTTLDPIVVDDVCRADLVGVDTATLSCVCGNNLGPAEAMDSSDLDCRTPDLAVAKVCVDADGSGSDDSFDITVTNLGTADLESCQVVDTIDLDESTPGTCPGDGVGTQGIPVVPASFGLASGSPAQPVTGSLGGDLAAPACNTAMVTCTISGTQKTITREVEADCFGGVCAVEIDKKVSGDGGATFLDTGAIGWNAYDSNGDGSLDMGAEPVAFQFTASNTGTVPVTCTLVDQHTGAQIQVPLPNGGVIQPGTTLDPIVVNDVCRADLVGVDTATLSCVCGNDLGPAQAMDSSDLDCRTPDLAIAKMCEDADGSGADDSFSITVSNVGSAPLVGCQVMDTVDLGESTPGTCPGDGLNTQSLAVSPMAFPMLAPGVDRMVTGGFGGDLGAPACNTASVMCTIAGTMKTISREVEEECFGGVCAVEIDKKVSGDGGVTFLDTGAIGWNAYDSTGDGVADMGPEAVAFQFTASNTGSVPVTCTLIDTHTGATIPVPLPNGGVIPPGQTVTPVVSDVCRADLTGIDTAELSCVCGNGFGSRMASDTSDLTCLTPDLDIVKDCDTQPGVNPLQIDVTNPGEAPLENCAVVDPLAPACDVSGFGLVSGEALPSILCEAVLPEDTFNEATVTCDIAGTNKTITRKDQALCIVAVPCEIEVEKTCCIPPPPAPQPPFVCSDAKPLDTLTMIWNGTQTVKVVAHRGKVSDPVLGTLDDVMPGDEVTFSGFAGAGNDVEWEIFLAGTSVSIGKSTFHLSCSDSDMNGPEDCGKAEGDGKGNSGFLNDWIFEGLAGDIALDCTLPDSEPEAGTTCGAAAPTPFVCSDAKPIDTLRMIWQGASPVKVVAHAGSLSAAVVGTVDDVQPGQEVSISGFAGSPNDVEWELFLAGTSVSIGKSTFHRSCSDGDMNGPEDCGKAEGNGKSNDGGLINDWVFDGMAGNDQDLDCTPAPPEPLFTDECVLSTPAGPHCTGGVRALILRYVGGGCEETTNTQGRNLGDVCAGVDPGDGPVSVTITKDEKDVAASPTSGIGVGDLVTIAPTSTKASAKLKASTKLRISGQGSQDLAIHTSCSKPLNLGDRFGAFEVFGIDRTEGGLVTLGSEVEYQYTLHNTGETPVDITSVVDDKLGNLLEGFCDLPDIDCVTGTGGETRLLLAGNATSPTLFRTATLFETTKNTVDVLGEGQNSTCMAQDMVTVDFPAPPPPPFVCKDAKPLDSLTMIWNGTQAVKVTAYKGAIGSTPLGTIDNVQPGDEVTFTGFAGAGNDVVWQIFLAGTNTVLGKSTFHRSCSDSDMNGPEDCGKPEGDGKGNSGFLNDWIFEGMGGNGLTLDCTIDQIAPLIQDFEVLTTKTQAFVSWMTDEPATAVVRYGLSSADMAEADRSMDTEHMVMIPDLIPNTQYVLQIESEDRSGNTTVMNGETMHTQNTGRRACGIGFELAFVLPLFVWLRRRRATRR